METQKESSVPAVSAVPEDPEKPRPTEHKRRGLGAKHFGLFFLSLVCFAGCAEVGLRFFAPQNRSWLPIYRRHPELPMYALDVRVRARQTTGEVDFVVCTDGQGFRVAPERMGTNDPVNNSYQVLWLGDSFTFGYGVNHEESIVGLLEKASPEGFLHRNAGVPGYGPLEYSALANYQFKAGATPPHVVVTFFVGNDFSDANANKDSPVVNGLLVANRGWRGIAKTSSHLYRLLASGWHRIGVAGEAKYQKHVDAMALTESWSTPITVQAVRRVRWVIASLASKAKELGIQLHFVILPTEDSVRFVHAGNEPTPGGPDPRLPTMQMRSLLDDYGADYLDMLPILAEKDPDELYFVFDGHFRPFGYGVCAASIAERWPGLIGE